MTIEPDGDAERKDDWPLDEHQPPACPICGAPAIPIAYGMPSRELMDLAKRGAVHLGGCVMRPNQPTHKCPAGHAFHAQAPG